ncbi:MAG: sterol desaturase family protein [Acidobacteriota bacterium]|nr:sterol desaturase family protein [Acidobacteriota bacterium]
MRPVRRPGIGPVSAYKREQAAISRRKLYRVTAFYTACVTILLVLGLRTNHPYVAMAFFVAGVPLWTFTEYTSHRFVFHRHWKMSNRKYKKYFTYLTHKYLDPTHFGHHERPFDGEHINGQVKDLLPIFLVAVPVSFLFPTYTCPMLLAGVVQCYVAEEWIHHSMHYYNFQNAYFRHIKKSHLYHHSSQGIDRGYGITNAFWDVVFNTRFPPPVRARLFGRSGYSNLSRQVDQSVTINESQGLH